MTVYTVRHGADPHHELGTFLELSEALDAFTAERLSHVLHPDPAAPAGPLELIITADDRTPDEAGPVIARYAASRPAN